jgi:uncharacterized membrane protein (DUF485 family)
MNPSGVNSRSSNMSISKAQFRWLVTAHVVVTILAIIVTFAGESSLPEPLRDYVAAQYEADLTASKIVIAAIGIPLIIALAVSIIGLYLFWWFARPLSVIVWAIGLILQPFAGPYVDWGLAVSLYELAALLMGVVLAVIYITPAKVWFDKTDDTQ